MNERISVARKSTAISCIERVSSYVLGFITRRIILNCIGVDYLGLNSTLTQILGTLSVTELGIQAVITFRLYKPVVEGDRKSICELMSVIRFFYRIVALIIMGGAVILLPFLQWFITDISIPWGQVYIAWLVMAASSALSYTMNYNGTILFADQKQYIYQGIHLLLNIAIVIPNLVVLYHERSYILYLLINVVNTISGNLVLLTLRKRLYPWVHFVKTSRDLVKDVARSTMDVFVGRVNAYIFNSTDNIVISALVSTAIVGYISNYSTISFAVTSFITGLCGPIQAIAGNMLAGAGENRAFLSSFIKRFSYVLYIIGSVLILPTALLLDDFVILLYGREYVIDKAIVLLLIADVYISMAQISTGIMLDVDGQFKIQKRYYIISSIINIVLSVTGALTIGVVGVALGTVIGRFYLWICRAYYCYKIVIKSTKDDLIGYILYNVKMLFVFLGLMILLKIVYTNLMPNVSITMFATKGLIAVVTAVVAQVIIFGRTEEFKYVMELFGANKVFKKQ